MAKKVYWVLNDRLGEGDPELAKLLMKKFLYNLARVDEVPEKMIFMNNGVRLTTEGSEVLDDLRLLAERGVMISPCGTCTDFYGVSDRLQVGGAGAMDGTVASVNGADDVVVLR